MTSFIDNQIWEKYKEDHPNDWWKTEEMKEQERLGNIPKHKRISAQEARNLLEAKNKEYDEKIDDIMELIHKAIDRHDNYCYVTGYIPEYVINQLVGLGYNIGPIEKGDRPFDSDYRKISF